MKKITHAIREIIGWSIVNPKQATNYVLIASAIAFVLLTIVIEICS